MSAEFKGCATGSIYFLDLLYVRYDCAKFHYCEIFVTNFKEGGLFATQTLSSFEKAHPE